MNQKIERLLKNEGDNYILPFFWQHGEDEATLRKYMQVIDESNIGAVCVESRPHPDFCGPKWWEDMDIIFDEAKKRNMKVWILDDSHFPTGFANGAMSEQPQELYRQSICCRTYDCSGGNELKLSEEEILHPEDFQPSNIEAMMQKMHGDEKIKTMMFDDDRLLGIYGVRTDGEQKWIDLKQQLQDNELTWQVPEGSWRIYVLHLTRNRGPHRNYINMLDKDSCRVLIDAVYEPHLERYRDEFGQTLAGFFSDEPELGNGHLYESGNKLGYSKTADFPWSRELEMNLEAELGKDFPYYMTMLWENEADEALTAKARYTYMDQVTKLVEKNFSFQMGDWCREHGVQYIGHLIEDNDQHARMGSSLGHFFRGLGGQDMSGIDDIGGQVFPQGEDISYDRGPFQTRNGQFYHYMLGKLGSSAAAIEPLKHGDSMCEIFGAYGWSEGVRLEKYLVDHFLVRGINHYVPHAFSAKAFPDPDCPPHFYAHGHNPQYRHFGQLMAYTNRVCELIAGGHHIAPIAVLYHGEGEWSGTCMFSHEVGRVLTDAQLEYDYIPQDVFAKPETYLTEIREDILKVNTQGYKLVIVPTIQFITKAFAEAIIEMRSRNILVVFIDRCPEGICDEADEELLEKIRKCETILLTDAADTAKRAGAAKVSIMPADNRVRYYQYEHQDGSAVYLFVNEGTERYLGTISLKEERQGYQYDAWENVIYPAEYEGKMIKVEIEPLKSMILVFDDTYPDKTKVSRKINSEDNKAAEFSTKWQRSICRSLEYPEFSECQEIVLPDNLAEEKPKFSGFVRYENTFHAGKDNQMILEITDAHEGVEVFVNGVSLGIQVAPPFIYDLSAALCEGANQLVIEVATTLERELSDIPDIMGNKKEPASLSGITGRVRLYQNMDR